MCARIAPENSARILAVVPTPGFSGHAVLDGWGLAPDSFATWKLGSVTTDEARCRSFNRRLLDSLQWHRPAVLVLGIPRHDEPRSRVLRESARQLAGRCGVIAVERSVSEARDLLLGCQRGHEDDALAACVANGFFPALERFRGPRQTIQRRYRIHAFEAVALALLELVERAPLSAAAVARDEAFAMGRFNTALAASARRHFPDNL
jgi:hypothetical protein